MSARTGVSRVVRVVDPAMPRAAAHGPGGAIVGASRVVRVWGERTCTDAFDRTVDGGWGASASFIGGWTSMYPEYEVDWPDAPSAHLDVDGSVGHARIVPSASIKPMMAVRASWATATAARGEMRLRFRRVSSGGVDWAYGPEVYGLLNPASQPDYYYGEPGQMGWGLWSDWLGTVYTGLNDLRWDPGDPYHRETCEITGDPATTLTAWWNVRVRVDAWGTYMRAWMDGEAEDAHLAALQPSDTWGAGCSQGGGLDWSAWKAYADDVPPTNDIDLAHLFLGIVWPDVTPWVEDRYEFDYVSLTGCLCGCG